MGEQQPTQTWREYFSENYSYAVNGLWSFGSETFRDAGLIISDLYKDTSSVVVSIATDSWVQTTEGVRKGDVDINQVNIEEQKEEENDGTLKVFSVENYTTESSPAIITETTLNNTDTTK